MINIEDYVKPYVSSSFSNGEVKLFVLNRFYDFSINDDIYYSINMVEIKGNYIILHDINKTVIKSYIDKINYFKIYLNYEKIKLNLIKYLLYMGISSIMISRLFLIVVH